MNTRNTITFKLEAQSSHPKTSNLGTFTEIYLVPAFQTAETLELSVGPGASMVMSEISDLLGGSQQICFYFLVLITFLIPNIHKLGSKPQKSGDKLKKKCCVLKQVYFGNYNSELKVLF